MINDPLFGRGNRHLYPEGPEQTLRSPIELGHDRGPTDAPSVAGTPSETTVQTKRQLPPMHPSMLPVGLTAHRESLLPYRKPETGILIPRYGVLYDSQRTEDGWNHFMDVELEGTVVTAATVVNTTISLPNFQAVDNRVMRYPGATSFYLCIRSFNAAPTTLTGTGVVTWKFLDKNNNFISLGSTTLAASVQMADISIICPAPYTDPTDTKLGTLIATTTTGANFPTYVYQIGFSYVYLLPVADEGAYVHLGEKPVAQKRHHHHEGNE